MKYSPLITVFLVGGCSSAPKSQHFEAPAHVIFPIGSITCSDPTSVNYMFVTAPERKFSSPLESGMASSLEDKYHPRIQIDRNDGKLQFTSTSLDTYIVSNGDILSDDPGHIVANVVEHHDGKTSVVTYQLDMTHGEDWILSSAQTLSANGGDGFAALTIWGCKKTAHAGK